VPPARLVYVVGRDNSVVPPDLAVPRTEITVGKKHAELSVAADGSCHLRDLGSKNGTYIRSGEKWTRAASASLSLNDPIRLGEFETTPAALLRLRRAALPPPLPRPHAARHPHETSPHHTARPRHRRNPATGEIE